MSVIIRLENLSWNASSLDVRRYFYGLDIPDGGVHIVGGEQGTVFIAFATDEDARQAMLKDNGRICNEPIKLLLSSKTEMQNVIASGRGASGPIHEVFLGPGFGRNVSGPLAQSEGQHGYKSFSEETSRRQSNNSPRFSPLRPERIVTHVRPYPDMFPERQQFERSPAYEENRYLKEQQSTISQGRARVPFDDTRAGNERVRDQWNSEGRKESEADFRGRPDVERFGDWVRDRGGQEEREVEVRQGNFSNRRVQTSRDGPRPSQVDFERNQSRNFKDDARFPPSQREFYGGGGGGRPRSQDRWPSELEYFGNVHPSEKSDHLSGRYPNPQDTDRRPLGLKGQSSFEQKGGERGLGSRNEPHGDWFVHVYNLPLTFNYREVRRFFSKSIIPQDGLKLINDRNGQRMGECYIKLANEKGFWSALDCNNTPLYGKPVIVERTSAQEFDDAWDSYVPARSRSRSPLERNAMGKVYYVAVKNLPYNKFSEDDLMKWLGSPPLGADSGPYFGYDGVGNKLGKAFLKVNSFKDFQAILSCNGKDWQGRTVQVTASGERIFYDRRSIAKKWNASGKRDVNIDDDRVRSEGFTSPGNSTTAKDEEKKFYCIRILGLPFTANPQAIKEFFKGLEIANGGIHIVYNQDNQATGFGFVQFVTSTDCRRALERNNQYMGKRYLMLEPAAKEDVLREFNSLQQKYGGVRDGSADSASHSCGPDAGASETVVRMKNLHFKVQLEDILQFFKGHHPIMESVKLQYRDGRPTGDGLISFASFMEAERAVKELNRQKLLGWPLTMTLM